MSGRAYARNPTGALGGATDINSIVPHRFRIEAPTVTSKAKELAIRRAIQRRCKEKNWKKLLRMRHTRLVPLVSEPVASSLAVENGVAMAEKPVDTTAEKSSAHAENGETKHQGSGETTIETGGADTGSQDVNSGDAAAVAAESEATATPGVTVYQHQQEALDKTKQQLQEMEERLATLSAEKHAKFQQLKDILIAEARSKIVPPMPKKRRVDSLGLMGTGTSPRLLGASGSGGTGTTFEGAGLSLLGAPSPSLLRAQSFTGVAMTPSHEVKDARRL